MSTSSASAGKRLRIRKYPNRRYYDATHSRHLTLEEIRSLIREGYDIEVTDSKTGADITAQVLTQIILELETSKIDSFPVGLLVRLIRSNDEWVRTFLENYFHQAFKSYMEYQRQLEERMRQMPGPGGMFNPMGMWGQAGWGPFAGTPQPGPATPDAPSPAPEPPPEAAADLKRTVEDLQQQLTALREQVKAGKGPKRPRRKR